MDEWVPMFRPRLDLHRGKEDIGGPGRTRTRNLAVMSGQL